MTDTSSTKNAEGNFRHQYAANYDQFPGALTARGATAQTLRPVPAAVFIEPKIRASDKLAKKTPTRKSARK